MKKAVRCVVFLLLFVNVYICFNNIFVSKVNFGTTSLTEFYAIKKKSIDVLFVGSSHVFNGIDPVTTWTQEGISAYCLTGSGLTTWEAYAQLKEALQYQAPKLIVFDAYSLSAAEAYNEVPNNALGTIGGMKFSPNRLYAVFVSVPPIANQRENAFLGLPIYHSRYNDLSKSDFSFLYGRNLYSPNGYGPLAEHTDIAVPEEAVRMSTAQMDIPSKSKAYFLRILDLAERHHIPVLLTVLPYATTLEERGIFNRAAALAQEQGCEFLDYSLHYDQILLDFATDMANYGHLNPIGAEKLTRHLAQYIREHYDIPDRRNDPDYAEWHEWAEQAGARTHAALAETLALVAAEQ